MRYVLGVIFSKSYVNTVYSFFPLSTICLIAIIIIFIIIANPIIHSEGSSGRGSIYQGEK